MSLHIWKNNKYTEKIGKKGSRNQEKQAFANELEKTQQHSNSICVSWQTDLFSKGQTEMDQIKD